MTDRRWAPLLLASPAVRVAALTLLAFAVYGGWALAVNWLEGLRIAVVAGVAQGASSAAATLFSASIIEFCYARWKSIAMGLLLAWLVPPTLTGMLHAVVQWSVGTPEILVTIIFPVVMGYAFAGVYVRSLMRLEPITQRDRSPP